MNEYHNGRLERRLAGTTLRVYLYLQKKREPSGIRQVQRDLSLSSPSVAEYQVEKLIEMGLAKRDSYGKVFVARKVSVKAMDSYVNFGRLVMPRLALYATLFTGVAAIYVLFNFNSLSVYGVAIPGCAAAIFWFEAWRLWNYGLFEKTKRPVEKDYFWVSLMPGLAALAAFIAGVSFLFYYVEPNNPASTVPPPPDLDALPFQSNPPRSLPMDDLRVLSSNAGDLWSEVLSVQMITLLSTWGLVAGFVLYLMVKFRCNRGVLLQEHE